MRRLILCTLAILFPMLLAACVSPQVATVEKTVVPEIVFPTFPLAEKMTDNKDGTVSVPSEWLVRLEEYHIRIGETERNYDELKELYERGNQ